MSVVALVALALVLSGPVPRLMARRVRFRRSPRAALVVWQAVSGGAVLAALAAAALVPVQQRAAWLVLPALMLGGLVLGRLLLCGHRVGTRLRAARRTHRELVDVLAVAAPDTLRVIAHPTPTAYCLPGLRRRLVLSQGLLDALPRDQLTAVVTHERAHLRARHDLVLEFFTVLHHAGPSWWRCPAAMAEVRLLVEVLADQAAVRAVGATPTARALVALAHSHAPDAALAAGGSTARARLELLSQAAQARPVLTGSMYLFAAVVLATPPALFVAGIPG